MYLKSLELHGFKSFPNKTVLTFERGATVVVGPNGSGKSNISDAMKWVLGEISSRNIRGNRMEDVIFGGTDDRRPMSFAEVSVTFDNTDKEYKIDSPYNEITVTRRYYRAGDSEYFINKKPVRLKDIHELFMNTGIGREGYSIIGQGKVAEMISKKSEERRNIFEEAAGISKHRHKKQEAERKLKETDDNMVRIKDIWIEIDSRIAPLEKAAEKTKKYKILIEEKKRCDVSLWLFDTKKLREDLQKTEQDFILASNEYERISESLNSLEMQSDRIHTLSQDNIIKNEHLLGEIRSAQARLNDINSDYALAEMEHKHSKEKIDSYNKEIEKIDSELSGIREEIKKLQAAKTDIHEELAELEKNYSGAISTQTELTQKISDCETRLNVSLSKLEKVQKQSIDLQVKIDVIAGGIESNQARKEELRRSIEKYEAEKLSLQKEADDSEENAKQFKDKIAEQDVRIEELRNEIDTKLLEKEELELKLSELRNKKSALLQRANTLKQMDEQFEGYSDGVRHIMNKYAQGILNIGTIYGPLSKLISTEDKYTLAIETSLGANIQHVVVDNEETAKAAINELKTARAGKATFYPVSAIKSQTETEEIRQISACRGYIARADELVECDSKFKEILGWLLTRTVIFDNLDNASAAAKATKYRVKIVTLDGQVINAGGSYTGGSVRQDTRILSRTAHIEEMFAEAERMDKEIAVLKNSIDSISSAISDFNNEIKDCEQNKQILLTVSRSHFAAIDQANARLEANESMLAKVKSDLENLEKTENKSRQDIITLSDMLEDINSEAAEIRSMREQTDTERREYINKRDELISSSNDVFLRINDFRNEERTKDLLIENARDNEAEKERTRKSYLDAIAEVEKANRDFEDNQIKNRTEFAELDSMIAELELQRKEILEGNAEYDKRQTELKAQIKEKREQQEISFRSYTKLESKLSELRDTSDKLAMKLVEEYELTYEDAVRCDYPPVTKENRPEIVSELSSVRAKIRALGDINPTAEEEYAKEKEKYDYLTEQLNDLNKSHEDLNEIIRKIESEMKTRFLNAFTQINKNFGVTFAELFGGGTGEISLVDPEDVLNSGIDIKVAPPGKIINNLSLLSGGEQSFVAIALFFAILKLTPTPFCILDEIEAALDEVNVFKFGEYVKKFSKETQFVLITHRRGTMEAGDRLYGVTMPEKGISRVLPLDISEIESKKKELLA